MKTSELPKDVIIEILSWLPAKSLLRFKFVCKYWFDLIRDPSFVRMHLHHSTQINNYPVILISSRPEITVCGEPEKKRVLYTLNCGDFVDSSSPNPLSMDYHGVECLRILGSCYGLICLCYEDDDDDDLFVLWNPCTGKLKKLPIDSSTPIGGGGGGGVNGGDKLIIRGFCYDHTIDDYKVIKTVHYKLNDDVYISEVNVYTLGTNSWSRKPQTNPLLNPHWQLQCFVSSPVFVNGALNWIMRSAQGYSTIVSFDIVKEEYREIQKPDPTDNNAYKFPDFHVSSSTLQVLDGCLCVFQRYLINGCVEVWMMKDYGVKESWTKLFTMNMVPLMEEVCQQSRLVDLNLLKYCKDGRILMVWDNNYLVLYDPKNEKARILFTFKDRVENAFVEETYIETLVSLKGTTDQKKGKRRRRVGGGKDHGLPPIFQKKNHVNPPILVVIIFYFLFFLLSLLFFWVFDGKEMDFHHILFKIKSVLFNWAPIL